MSKLEIVRKLNDCEPQLMIVDAVRKLQQTTQQMSDDLKLLPEAIAEEVAPLIALEQRVEDICQTQRAVIIALVEEIAGQTSEQLNKAANRISNAADQVSDSVQTLDRLNRQQEITQAEVMGAKITNLSSQLDALTSQVTVLSDKMSILVKFSQNQYLG